MKLHQLIALLPGRKVQAATALKESMQKANNADLTKGIYRTYQPVDDEGEVFPSETASVQVNIKELAEQTLNGLVNLIDTVCAVDTGNQVAVGTIKVDGKVIAKDLSVASLLYLEKELIGMKQFVQALPILNPSMEWSWSDNANCYVTPVTKTTKTKKVPRNHVMYEATPEHPAQVQIVHEDVTIGHWSTINRSGAIPVAEKLELLKRITKLIEACKLAREDANTVDVTVTPVGKTVVEYILDVKSGSS